MNKNFENDSAYMVTDFQCSAKTVRKFGRNLGFGVVMGCYMAFTLIKVINTVSKRTLNYIEKNSKFTEEDLKGSKQMTDEEEQKEAEEFFKEN